MMELRAHTRLSASQGERLDALASTLGKSRSQVLRLLIERAKVSVEVDCSVSEVAAKGSIGAGVRQEPQHHSVVVA